MRLVDGMLARGILKILVIFVLILMPLLLSGLTISEASLMDGVIFKEPHISLDNSVLVAGGFHYFDVTLDDERDNICIIAYNGDTLPDFEDRSYKNYYRWEYDHGVWKDTSGHESLYLEPSECLKENHTYSFYLGIDREANKGRWTIKVMIDNGEMSSTSSFVVVADFGFFLSAMIGVFEPCVRDKNPLVSSNFICSDRKRIMTESEKNIRDGVDEVLRKHAASDQEKSGDEFLDLFVSNEMELPHDELVESTVSTYPKSKLKKEQSNSLNSLFFNKKLGGGNGFWPLKLDGNKKILTILLAIILLSASFSIITSKYDVIEFDGKLLAEQMESTLPNLSDQTYENMIQIEKAEHLDGNRIFISDIYEEVKDLDGVWSERIPSGDYIQVTFERKLTSSGDITVHARNNQGLNTVIEVYYVNSTEKITEFPVIKEAKCYKVTLTNIAGSHDIFDLRVKNLDNNSNAYLEFDHIIDPPGSESGFKVYRGSFEFTSGLGTSYDAPIGATIDTDHAFLVMYIAGSGTPDLPNEGATSGYIYNATYLRFERNTAVSGLYISWFIVECLDSEFTVRGRGAITLDTTETSDIASVSGVTDMGQCSVNSNFRSDGNAATEWDAATSRVSLTAVDTVTAYRFTTDTQTTVVRYEVVEWNSDFNVYNGTFTMDSGVDTALISGSGSASDPTITMSRSIVFATWDQPNQGLKCAGLVYWISDTNELTFMHEAGTLYTKDITWYLIEFPSSKAPTIQRWEYYWQPSTAPDDVRNNSMTEVNLSRTFIRFSSSVQGTGTAFMRAYNLPRITDSTHWTETQYNPNSGTYDDHNTSASIIELPYNTNTAPTQSNESPTNDSTGINLTPQLSVIVNDTDTNTLNATWWSNNSGLWVQFASNSSIDVSSGAVNITQTNSNFSDKNTKYWWSVNVTDEILWTNQIYSFTTRDNYTPNPASDFTASANGRFQIDLSWTDHAYSDSTRVEWNAVDDPGWDIGDYDLLYNGSSGSTLHTGLEPSTTRFYKAWSFNATDGVWSNGSIDSNTTADNNPPVYGVTSPANGSSDQSVILAWSIEITDIDIDTFNWTIECSNGQNNSANDDNDGTKQLSLTGLEYLTNYVVWVNTTDSYNWTREWYNFTTGEASDAPTVGSEDPLNESTGIAIIPELSVIVDDSNDDIIYATWFSNSSGTWIQFGENLSIDPSSGPVTIRQTNSNFSIYNKTYWWSVNATDGSLWTNQTYHFKTNIIPTQNGEYPSNDSSGINILPSLHVICSDEDNDIMTTYWYSNSSGSWSLFATNGSVSSGTNISQINIDFSNYTTTYWWSVNLTDGKDWENNTYHLTTGTVPVLTNPFPFNGSVGVNLQPVCNITVSDQDGGTVNVSFYENATGPSWTLRQTNESVDVSSPANIVWNKYNNANTRDVTYWWKVNVTDSGGVSIEEIYHFSTTVGNPSTVALVNPYPNGTTGVDILPTCRIWANDSDGDTLTVYWYENTTESWTLRNTNNSVVANSTVSFSFPQFNDYYTTYHWKVLVNDSYDETSAIYHFTTTETMNTTVDDIIPYGQTTSPTTITATATEGIPDNVTLRYRYSNINESWVNYETGIEENVNGWTTVNLDNTYINPVVIVTGQEGGDVSLGVEKSRPRIRNVGSTSFEVIVTNDTGVTVTEDVGYIVMEEGHWDIDGVEVEAGNYTVSDAGSHIITFSESFPGNTVVVDTIQEDTTVDASSRYTEDSMTSTGYEVYWEGYDDNSNLATVTAGYIAVELGSSSSIFESGIADEVADDPGSGTWSSVSFSNSYSVTPILFTNPIDSGGGDPTIVGRRSLSTTGVNVRCTEGQNQDSEMDHAINDIPWVVWTETTVSVINWTEWNDITNPDENSPWSWDFDFPNGEGYYEFYSIGKKSGLSDESAPSSADAICKYNLAPTLTEEGPSTGSTEIDLIPKLNVTVDDNDELTAYWYSNSTGPWALFATNSSIDTSGGAVNIIQTNSNFYSLGTEYWWSVNVTDGLYWTNETYNFTTNYQPTISSPNPANESSNQDIMPVCNVTVSDQDGGTVDVCFYDNSTGPWALRQTNNSVDVTTAVNVVWDNYSSASLYETTYWWKVNVTDGGGVSIEEIYHFTTSYYPVLSNPNPANDSISVIPNTVCEITVSDQDGGTVDVCFYDNSTGPWVLRQTNNSVDVSIPVNVIWDSYENASQQNTTYWWKVNVTDGEGLSTEEIYHFTTAIQNPPQQSGENPTDTSTNIPIIITNINVTIEDPNGDPINWTIETSPNIGSQDNSSSSEGNGSKVCSVSGLAYGTTYTWYVNSSDGVDLSNEAYTFTTSYLPELTNPGPNNGSTGQSLAPICNVTVSDQDGGTVDVYFYENTTGSWVIQQTNNSVDVTAPANMGWNNYNNASSYNTTYWWKVNVTDGEGLSTEEIYHFITEPMNTSVDAISPYHVKLSPFTISATNYTAVDNVTLWYRYYNVNSTWVNYETGVRENVNGWTTVNLDNTYVNPVVIASGQEGWDNSDENEVTSRPIIRNVNSDNFEVRVIDDEGNNIVTDVGYLVIEEGHWEIDGVEVEAGTYTRSSTASASVTFQEAFPDDNVVIVDTCQNDSGTYPLTSRYTETTRTSTGYTVYHESFDVDAAFPGSPMTFGYLAVQQGNPSTTFESDVEIEVNQDFGTDGVIQTTEWVPVSFSNTYTTTPILFVNPVDQDGGDPVVTGIWDLKTTGFNISLAEGDNEDSEQAHNDADCPWVAWTETTVSITDWTEWNNINNPDTSSPWSWDFDFPNGIGYYEFYSIGKKSGENDEMAPASADATCYYNNLSLPIINSYDLRNNTGSKLNNITGLLDINQEYIFQINITEPNGWENIEFVNISAWYDNGSDATIYNQSNNLGGNLNMNLQCENTTGTAIYRMLWPDDESQINLGNCTETIVNRTTRIINISFVPGSQIRWAGGDGGWDTTQNATNDQYSWNFNITVKDEQNEEVVKMDEYGIYRYTSIQPISDWVDVYAAPGTNDDSSIVTITYSSNYDFNMSIYFEENLTNATWADNITIANNVEIKANADPNDDVTTDKMFTGIGEENAVDIFNVSGFFSNDGFSKTVNVQFNVYIPFGIRGGKYTARVATRIVQD